MLIKSFCIYHTKKSAKMMLGIFLISFSTSSENGSGLLRSLLQRLI